METTSTLAIPNDFKGNLLFRVEFHRNCEMDPTRKSWAMALFKTDIVAFFSLCLWTYDPRTSPSDNPFIPWDFQEDYIQDINQHIIDGKSLLTEKTRDMGVTWQILGVFLYRFLFFDENFLAGSRNEDLVDTIGDMDSHFERLRYMIKTCPDWVLEECGFRISDQGYMKIYKPSGASIVGESMNPNFSRQGRYNSILLDEFAYVDKAESIWMGCGESSPCLFPVSTPNGNVNTFARIRKSGKIEVRTLHWKLHPFKDEDWYEKKKENKSDQEVAQELDISYTVSSGKAFYRGFFRSMHFKKLRVNPMQELILGWDYGYHHPNCMITQLIPQGNLVILDNILGENCLITDFADIVRTHLNLFYPDYPVRCFGDPAGDQVSDKSELTSVQLLAQKGFLVSSRPSNLPETNLIARKQIIESRLKLLINGLPGIAVNDNPRTQIVAEAFEGGFHYPGSDRHGFIKSKPVRDGYYEHPMNSLDYIVVNLFSHLGPQNQKRRKPLSKPKPMMSQPV